MLPYEKFPPPTVFDFDKTLTYKDTLKDFFSLVGKMRFSATRLRLKQAIYFGAMVATKFRLLSNSDLKRWGVKLFVKGANRHQIANWGKFYAELITLNRVFEVNFQQHHGDAMIVTASFVDYVKPLFPNNVVVGAEFLYDHQGHVMDLKNNCYKEQKVECLNQLGVQTISALFTDSFSDKPLMDIAQKVYLVKGDSATQIKYS